MEISAENPKLMTNSADGIQTEIKIKDRRLEIIGAIVSDESSKPEVLSRAAQSAAVLTKIKPKGGYNITSLGSKLKLMRSLVIRL